MKYILSMGRVLFIALIAFSTLTCDEVEELQNDICNDQENKRETIEAKINVQVKLINLPQDNREVRVSLTKHYCSGKVSKPIIFEGHTTSAGRYAGVGTFKMENALDNIKISVSVEEETQDGKYYKGEKTLYYDDFNVLLPVLTLYVKDEAVSIYQGWKDM